MTPFLLALGFAVLIYIFEETVFLHPQSFFLTIVQDRGTANCLAGYLTTFLSFCFLAGFFWLSLRVRRRFRLIFLLIFALAVLVEFGYWKAFHRPFSSIDLQTAMASPPGLWRDALGLFFNPLAALPIAAYAVFLFLPGQMQGPRPLWIAAGLAACLAGNAALHLNGLTTNWGVSLPQFYKTVFEWALSDAQPGQRESLPEIAVPAPGNNIILIIDESIRSDHLSLNGYERPTTPFLEALAERSGLVYNWGEAASGGTCSPISNALIISGVRPSHENKNSAAANAQRLPTIFHYAHAMGYKTFYIDGQTDYLWNGLTANDLAVVDEWLNTRQFGSDEQVDLRAAEWMRAQVSETTGSFIVLNKKGVHFLYETSYPPEEAVWGPVPTDYREQPELVRNVYDNGVLYNVDVFFERLLADGDALLENTVIIYTSDHGETLFEDGVDWLHCNYTHMEAAVPLLVIGRLAQPPDTSYPASHGNLLPTALDLMGVPESAFASQYAPSLLRAAQQDATRRMYFSGDGSVMDFD
ncbi:MAG: sulfatase-like hydrolase/transferase [Anaerolineaceae bacterium]|nr:sulfatase-like hydrolase/transferase [Anaerolineaceae bacterium]